MRSDRLRRLVWFPVVAVTLIAGVLHALGETAPRESPELLTLFNTLFLGSVSLFTALLAWQSARHNPQQGVTSLGCGALILGLAGLLAGPLIHDMNAAITIFNVGLAGSGAFFVLSAARGLRARRGGATVVRGPGRVNGAYAATAVLFGLVAGAATLGLTPRFYTLAEGSTPLRFVVLALAAAAYVTASILFRAGYHRSHMVFALWFAAAMSMLASGVIIVALVAPGSPAGWVGRGAQWVGALFMFSGIISTARTLGSFALPLREALSEAELRLQLVMDGAGMGVFEFDYATERLLWDGTVRRHYDLDPAAPVDIPVFLSLVHPDDVESVRRLLAECADPAGDREFRAEYRIVRRTDGQIRWLMARGGVTFQDGAPLRMLGVLMDVTERRMLEETLAHRARLSDELNDLDAMAHSTLAVDEVLGRVLSSAAEAVGSDSAAIELTPTSGLDRLSWRHPDDGPAEVSAHASQTGDRVGAELYVRESSVGTLTLQRVDGRSFDAAESDFVRKLGTMMSLALTNSRLFEEQKAVSRGLQEHFVHELPSVEGLELEVVRQPAVDPLLVGGDFHDVHELPDGRVAVLIGDVEGKGVKAAGLTETVRSSVRSLCFVVPSPRYVLSSVNRLLLAEDKHQFVTAMLVLLDPRTGRGLAASAGHPPPLRLSHAGATFIEPPTGMPLGAFETEYDVFPFELGVGETLVLYTDGLTEARHGADEFGDGRLLEAAAALSGEEPRDVVMGLRRRAIEFADSVRDDLEVLAVRRMGVIAEGSSVPAPSLTLTVPQWAGSLRHVRASVRDFLRMHDVDETIVDDLLLCIDEACANGLQHGHTDEPMSLRVELSSDAVEILISDDGLGFDPSAVVWQAPRQLLAGGRGLYLMQGLCDTMEISSGPGTAVRLIRRLRPETT